MTSKAEHIDRALKAFAEAQFAAGEWDRNESDEPWSRVFKRTETTEVKLRKLISADTAAVEAIHRILDGREWGAEDLESIAEIVRGTGRTIGEPHITTDACRSNGCQACRDQDEREV